MLAPGIIPTLRVAYLGEDRAAAAFLGGRLGITFSPPYEVVAVIEHDGTLRGGYVLTNRSMANVDLTVYGRGCMTRCALRAVAHYIFNILACQRATARCRRSNTVIRALLPRIGFQFEGVARRYFGPTRLDDGMTYGGLAEDFRYWEKAKH